MIPVLCIAFEFPPLNTAGVHRSAKFVKYLREYGFNPIVLTLRAEDAAGAFGVSLEPSLIADLPADLPLYRLPIPNARPAPRSLIGGFLTVFSRVQDPFAAAARPALAECLAQITERHAPRAVYVSLPPFSAGGFAVEIAKRLNLPLITDMRDGWSHWCTNAFPSYVHWALVHRRERALFEASSRVVTVTRQLADIFKKSHPEIPASRFSVVANGYDGSLNLSPSLSIDEREPEAIVTVGYVGNYYYTPVGRESAFTPWWRRRGHRKIQYQPVREDWLYRSPYFFLRALAELRRREPELGRRIRFVHVGTKPDWMEAMVAEHHVEDAVTYRGVVPHAQVLSIAKTFDAQLCTSVKVEGGEDYALASKTFDYVLAGRPILGLVTRGSQREFLEQSGLALVADADDLDACVAELSRLARGGFELRPNHAFLSRYERRATAGQLAQVIRDTLLPAHPARTPGGRTFPAQQHSDS